MATSDSANREPLRLSFRAPRSLRICLAIALLSLPTVVAGEPADEEGGDDEPLPMLPVMIAAPGGDLREFNAATRKELDMLLRQKIAIVDRLCGLTDSQKETLQLAGRGDIKRWLDRFEENQLQWRLFQNDRNKVRAGRNKVRALAEENHRLMRLRDNQPALSNDGSLFVKSLEKFVTGEKSGRHQPLRDILRAGGMIEIRYRGSDKLLEINVGRTEFADGDLAHVSALTGINSLILAHTKVTDAGLSHLKELTELRELWLGNTQLTDAGLAPLKGLTKLERVWLDDAPVTDAGLVHLKELTNLYGLSLTHTQATDAGLVHLKGLTKLKWLYLDVTQVTDAGVIELHHALPGLRIHR
jgi:hypothetical protein